MERAAARVRPARSRARKDNSELGVLAGADVDFSRAAMLLHDDVMAKGKAEARFLRQRASGGMPVSAESCRRSRCSMLRHVPLNSGVSLLPVRARTKSLSHPYVDPWGRRDHRDVLRDRH